MALSRTTKHLRTLVLLTITLEVIGVFLYLSKISILKGIVQGDYVSSDMINQLADWSYLQFVLHLALYSFAGLFFLRWTYVSQAGNKFFDSEKSKSLKEVLFLWLIPIFNLFRPLQHILGFSLQQYIKTDSKSLKNYRSLITVWWFMWLTSGPVGFLLEHFSFIDQSVDQSPSYMLLYLFLEIISIATGLLLIVILNRQLQFIRKNN